MYMENYSLKMKFKYMDERKASYCVNKGDEPQSNDGDKFGGRNQKMVRRVDSTIGHISLLKIWYLAILLLLARR